MSGEFYANKTTSGPIVTGFPANNDRLVNLEALVAALLKRIEALESLDHAIDAYEAATLVIEKRRMGEAKSWISSPPSNEDGA